MTNPDLDFPFAGSVMSFARIQHLVLEEVSS